MYLYVSWLQIWLVTLPPPRTYLRSHPIPMPTHQQQHFPSNTNANSPATLPMSAQKQRQSLEPLESLYIWASDTNSHPDKTVPTPDLFHILTKDAWEINIKSRMLQQLASCKWHLQSMNMLILVVEGTIKKRRKTHIENINHRTLRKKWRLLGGRLHWENPKKWKHTPKKNVENKNTKICGNQTLEKKTHWTNTYFETLGWNPYIPKTSVFSHVLLLSVLFKMVCFFPNVFWLFQCVFQCFFWLVSMFFVFFIICFSFLFLFFFKFCSPQDLCFVFCFFCVCLQLL